MLFHLIIEALIYIIIFSLSENIERMNAKVINEQACIYPFDWLYDSTYAFL